MPRKLTYTESMVARFPPGTLAALDEVREEGEDRATLVRAAVAREIERRSKARRMRRQASAARF